MCDELVKIPIYLFVCLFMYLFNHVSRTFDIIIIGPRTDLCKLGPFCLQATEAYTVRDTPQTKGPFFTWGERRGGGKLVLESIIYTSKATLQGFSDLWCIIHHHHCQRTLNWPLLHAKTSRDERMQCFVVQLFWVLSLQSNNIEFQLMNHSKE